MDQVELYHRVCADCSKVITNKYTTSFSLGIMMIPKKIRADIYAIYGFVRFADEIADTFVKYPQDELICNFREETYKAIRLGCSFNPVLHSFQKTVHKYNIPNDLIDSFLHSMQMDLSVFTHTKESLQTYIFGSAQAVGLMCLKVFCEDNTDIYKKLEPGGMALGAAFQKINFMRDVKNDFFNLKRNYFPNINLNKFDEAQKKRIEEDLERDFQNAFPYILQIPKNYRFAVLLSYTYFYTLFKKIKKLPPEYILQHRVRISNTHKIILLILTFFKKLLNN